MAHPREKGERLGRGRTAEIFSWGSDRVLKLFLRGIAATEVAYEAQATKAASDARLPVPGVEGIVEVEGRWGIIYERLDGPILSQAMISKPWNYPRLARMMADLHVSIHSCQLPGLTSYRDALAAAIRSQTSLSDGTREKVLQALKGLPDGEALCHGDFHPDNIIMSARGPVIIDWKTAGTGNPLADVVRTSLLLRVGSPPDQSALSRRLHTIGGSLVYSVYVKRYRQLKAYPPEQMDRWLPVIAAARLAESIPEERHRLQAVIEAGLHRDRTAVVYV